MSDIIQGDFDKKEHKKDALQFSKANVYCDARVYAYYLYDLVEEINSHFWNNYLDATTTLEEFHAYSFNETVNFIKQHIGYALEFLYLHDDNKSVFEILKLEEEQNIKMLLNWLKDVGIEYRQAKVIDIKNFIGSK